MGTKGTLFLRSSGTYEVGKIFYLSGLASELDYQAAMDTQGTLNPRVYFSRGHKDEFVPDGQQTWFKTPIEARMFGTNAGFDVVEDLDGAYWNGVRNLERERQDALDAEVFIDAQAANGTVKDGGNMLRGALLFCSIALVILVIAGWLSTTKPPF